MDGTVLVADDDRTIRTVLTQALTRAGCKVHATSSLMTLMRWVEEGKGDLVISDVIMPDGNGLEALPRISRIRPGLPVIVISAQNTIMTAIQAAEAEAFDYLPKPDWSIYPVDIITIGLCLSGIVIGFKNRRLGMQPVRRLFAVYCLLMNMRACTIIVTTLPICYSHGPCREGHIPLRSRLLATLSYAFALGFKVPGVVQCGDYFQWPHNVCLAPCSASFVFRSPEFHRSSLCEPRWSFRFPLHHRLAQSLFHRCSVGLLHYTSDLALLFCQTRLAAAHKVPVDCL